MKTTKIKSRDRIGKKFGMLTILNIDSVKEGKGVALYADCLCECGAKTRKRAQSVLRGETKCCGCVTPNLKHGHAAKVSKAYRTWNGIKNRCYNEKDDDYKNYGARGITVCDRWKDSFEAFLEDMGEPPPNMSIDRIDNYKGYSKENCRYADNFTQSQNRRSNRVLEFNGEKQTISYWSRLYGIRHNTLIQRLDYGWPVELALKAPLNYRYNKKIHHEKRI